MQFNRATRTFRALTISLAIVLLTGAGLVTSAYAHAGSAAVHETALSPRPTIVLVHGAWADASSWAPVTAQLQHDGFTVDAPPNPLRGLDYDTATLKDYLATIAGPIVLVGHSYGGAVVTNAATGNTNVKALVFVDAFVPDAGESLLTLISAQPGSALAGDPSTVFNLVPYPGAPTGDVDTYIKPEVFHAAFAADLPTEQAAVMASSQRPLAFSAVVAPSGVPAWRTIPSWDIVGTQDKVLPPAEQFAMAQRAHAAVTALPTSHVAMLAMPHQVTNVIEGAARQAA
jgi:pimeloyl-ACP methyl ester carboxylesterase